MQIINFHTPNNNIVILKYYSSVTFKRVCPATYKVDMSITVDTENIPYYTGDFSVEQCISAIKYALQYAHEAYAQNLLNDMLKDINNKGLKSVWDI